MTESYTPYEVVDGDQLVVEDEEGNHWAGKWVRNIMDEKEDMITLGYHHDPMRGPRYPSRLKIDDLYRHTAIVGETGHGKSTLSNNIQTQLIERGYGVCLVDTKGTEKSPLLQQIPDERMDDVVIIDPEKHTLGAFSPMVDESSANYGRTIEEQAELFYELSGWDDESLSNLHDSELWERLVSVIPDDDRVDFSDVVGLEDEEFTEREERRNPILKKLAEDNISGFISSDNRRRINLYDAIENDKIVIFDVSDLDDIYYQVFLHQFNTAAFADGECEYFLSIDEFGEMKSNTPEGVIPRARAARLGIILTYQPGTLNSGEKDTVRGNCQNYIVFNVSKNQSIASSVAQVHQISSQKVEKLKPFECITHVTAENGYRSDNVMKVTTLPKKPPRR